MPPPSSKKKKMQKKSKAIIFAKRLAQTSRVVPLDGYNRKIEFEDEDGPPASWAQMGITMKASSSQSEIIFNDIHTHALKQGQPPADIWINDGEDGKYDSDSLGEQESGGEEDDQDNESKSNWSAPSPPRDHESQEATPPASHRKLPLPYRSSDNSSIGSAQRGELNWSPRSAQFVGSFEFTAGGQRASQDRLRPAGTSLGALLRSVGGLRSALQHVVQENNTLADLAVPESLKAGPPLLEKFAGWAFGATARSVPLAALAGLACVSVGGVGAALSTFAGCSALADDLLGLPSGDPGFPVLRGAVISSVVVALSGVGLQLLHGWISHAFVHQSRNCGAHGRLTCCGLTGSQDDFSHEDNSGLIWDSEGGEPNSSGSSSKKKRCSPLKCCGMGRRLQQLALWSLTARGRLLEALVAVVLAFVGLLLVGRLALGLAAGLIGVSAAQLACANLEAAANTAASSDDDGVPAAFYDTVVTAFANSGIGAALDALELEAGHDWTPLWLPVDSNQNLGSGASAQFASKLEAYTSGGVRNDDGQIYGFTAEAAALSLGDMCGSLEGARDHWRHALGYCLVFLVGQAVVLYSTSTSGSSLLAEVRMAREASLAVKPLVKSPSIDENSIDENSATAEDSSRVLNRRISANSTTNTYRDARLGDEYELRPNLGLRGGRISPTEETDSNFRGSPTGTGSIKNELAPRGFLPPIQSTAPAVVINSAEVPTYRSSSPDSQNSVLL